MINKLFPRLIAAVLLAVVMALPSFAQSQTFKGRIVDAQGEPLAGASLLVKGSSRGAFTDAEGRFELAVPSFPVTVVAGFIGLKDKEIVLNGNERQPFVIALTESENVLDDVVVVGYGTQKRVNLTGAVAVIDGKDLNQRPVTNAAAAIQGADPSLLLTMDSGGIESKNYNLTIRGQLSLNSGSPLVLVDGIESSLTSLNPNDIASISVLKDASACAIYGAEASAGVVVITTKSGEEGKTKINYNGRVSVSGNTTSTDFITTGYDYVTLCNEFYTRLKGHGAWTYSDDQMTMLEARRYDVVEDPSRPWVIPDATGTYKYVYLGNFDWYGYLFKRQRPETEHNISVTGGNDKVNYYASGRYLYKEGLLNGAAEDIYNSVSMRSKVDVKVTPWLTYSNNISFERNRYEYGGYMEIDGTEGLSSNGVLWNLIQNVGPNYVPLNPDGTVNIQPGFMADATSPIFSGRGGPYIVDTNTNIRTNNYLTLTNRFNAKIFEGLNLIADYSYRRRDKQGTYRGLPTPNSYDNVNKRMYLGADENVPQGQFFNGSIYDMYRDQRLYYDDNTINAYLQFSKSFAGHNVGGTVGMNFHDYRQSQLEARQKYSLSDALSYIDLDMGDPIMMERVKNTETSYRTLGYFARVNYDYKGRYLFEASARYDGSSRFPAGQRWAFIPSFSAGWRFSDEAFFEPLKEWWNNGKVRLSYGTLGNQQISNYYYWDTISLGQASYTFDGANKASTASVSAPVSSALTWEKVTTKNLGFDFGFLHDKITFMADFFIRDTKDMLTKAMTLPVVYGQTAPKTNAADLRTKGYELSLTWRDRMMVADSPLTWKITGSLSDYKTIITKFDNPTKLLSDNYVGKVLGDIWGYRVEGLFQTDEEAADYATRIDDTLVNKGVYNCVAPYNHLMAGDVKFKDLDGSGKIDTGTNTLDNPGDREIIGNNRPRYIYSLRSDLSWKGIDVSIFFQGIGKINWMPTDRADYFWTLYAYQRPSYIPTDFESKCWSTADGADNSNAYFPLRRGNYSRPTLSTNNDRYIQNAAYIRLKNLTVGYTIPIKIVKVQKARVYLSGENLWYWSPMKKVTRYIDPEVATASGGTYVDTVYPYSRTLSFGVDITF